MKIVKVLVLVMALLSFAAFCAAAFADEITFTFVNLSNATFSASDAGLAFDHATNIQVTDDTNGKTITLVSIDSGHTGAATDFAAGPPLVVDYSGAGANSVLVATGGHTYLSGEMEDSGRLEANYPDKAGAFLSRFAVTTVDPAVLVALGTSTHWEPEGSVSLTLAETAFDGITLNAMLGGGEFTITTVAAPVPEPLTLLLLGTAIGLTALGGRRFWWR